MFENTQHDRKFLVDITRIADSLALIVDRLTAIENHLDTANHLLRTNGGIVEDGLGFICEIMDKK